MKCELCNQNEANIVAIQMVNGNPQEIHICEQCAKENSAGFAIPISFQDFFQAILDIINMGSQYSYCDNENEAEAKEIICNICGMTYSEFKKTGRLGCENCYKTFKQLDTVLKNIHGSNRHLGKIPSKDRTGLGTKRELTILKQKLDEAVKVEDYEQAIQLRDRIKAIERGE